MNSRKPMSPLYASVLAALALILPGLVSTASGVTTVNVVVGDDLFSPASITNSVGDSAKWTWQGVNSHSSTGPGFPALWDSGIHSKGFVFTQKFSNAGTFPYRCVVHSFQKGTIVVQAALTNPPPIISIQSPTNGAVFAAPWTVRIAATASDISGTVTNVQFFAGSTELGSVLPASTNVTLNGAALPAGNYILKAVAFDNSAVTNASAPVAISVLVTSPIIFQNVTRPSATSFQFSYSTTSGLSYVIQRSSDLTPLVTNAAAATLSTFLDSSTSGPSDFYSVELQPNL